MRIERERQEKAHQDVIKEKDGCITQLHKQLQTALTDYNDLKQHDMIQERSKMTASMRAQSLARELEKKTSDVSLYVTRVAEAHEKLMREKKKFDEQAAEMSKHYHESLKQSKQRAVVCSKASSLGLGVSDKLVEMAQSVAEKDTEIRDLQRQIDTHTHTHTHTETNSQNDNNENDLTDTHIHTHT
eukprot:GHVR01004326.1.p1 GENE.GHVR01004326.1~~GHVR01004326.1.p1  ORF type:complete len:186 (-),score=74.02 GHVR01004326.1:281-838(-)